MRQRIFFCSIVLIIIIAYIVSCRRAGQWLVNEDEPVRADAIVILMGSVYDRVLKASDLYHQGFSNNIIMVETRQFEGDEYKEVNRFANISNTGQTRNIAVSLGVNPDSITVLPGGAKSTHMEATIIREYIAGKPEIDTILLVSSAEHTRRASLIFKSAFVKTGMPVKVVSIPSYYSDFNAEKWWKSRKQVKEVLMEYLKISDFYVFDRRKL
ncbi:MAG: YdcF family protein [Bacteroidales bacterium]|nr:YdcF family protein [Bacteroidales bacterium]